MEDRGFTEIELREMMLAAEGCREDIVEGRWIIETRHKRKRRAVIVEPDHAVELLVVVTAYPVSRRMK